MNFLFSELLDCNFPSATHVQLLRANGINLDPFTLGALTLTAGVKISGDLFDFNPDMPRAFITPVRHGEMEDCDPWSAAFFGEIVDLVAWHPKSEKYFLRTGNATWMGVVEPQGWASSRPVRVHRSIMNWVRSGGIGIALLTKDPGEQQRILQSLDAIEAEDTNHMNELTRIASIPRRVPAMTAAA